MIKRILISCLVLVVFAACGPDDGDVDTEKPSIGQFKDSNTLGLNYSASSYSGTTNEKGQFSYKSGEQVVFSVGNVILGVAAGDALITPVDLIANGSASATAVQNIVRFLLFLDDDQNPDNGIVISSEVQAAADNWGPFSFYSTDDFVNSIDTQIKPDVEKITGGEPRSLVSADAAEAHLKKTMRCSYAGAYAGTISGDQSGYFGFFSEAQSGLVRGVAYFPGESLGNQYVDVTGDTPMSYDQNVSFVSKAGTTSFNGNFPSSDSISGSWTADSGVGNFSGKRVGGSATAKYRFTGTLATNDGINGLFAFDMEDDLQISGLAYPLGNGQQFKATGTLTGTTLHVSDSSGFVADATVDIETGQLIDGTWSWKTSNTDISGTFEGDGCILN